MCYTFKHYVACFSLLGFACAPGAIPAGPAGSPDDRAAILNKLATTSFTKRVFISPRLARPSAGASYTASGVPGVQFFAVPADAISGSIGHLRIIFVGSDDDCLVQMRVTTSTYLLGQAITPSLTVSADVVWTAHPERPRAELTATSTLQPGATMVATIARETLGAGSPECAVAILLSMALSYSSSTP